jgi:hypothetical protein
VGRGYRSRLIDIFSTKPNLKRYHIDHVRRKSRMDLYLMIKFIGQSDA